MDHMTSARRLMRRQYGLITKEQWTGLHLSEWQLYHAIKRGELLRVRRGVYAATAVPPTREQAILAAVLAVSGAVASHATAGSLWGFEGVVAEYIEISTELPHQVRLDGVVGHRSCLLFDEDLGRRLVIPVTSRARTLVDLSGRMSAQELGPVLDRALRQGLDLDAVRRCIGRLPPAPGRRPTIIHRLLKSRLKGYDPGDSDLETKVLRWLVSAGLPPPRQQFRVRIGGRTFKLDLAYPDEKVAIELDGWDSHGTRTAFDDDRARANLLVLEGWVILRFTSRSSRDEVCGLVATARARFGTSSAA